MLRQLVGKVALTDVQTCSVLCDPVTQLVGRQRNHTYSLQPSSNLRKSSAADTNAGLDAQSGAQRQPGPSRGDPAGQAECPPTLTAGCLDRPSFGATVDHRAGACGLAQQRRDQLHHARAASEAGADLQAVSTGAGCAPREIDRARRPAPHRPSACAAAKRRWRRGGTRAGSLPNLRAWAGLRRARARRRTAPASLGAAGCVGRGGPRRRSVEGRPLWIASPRHARRLAQPARKVVSSASARKAPCA